MGKIMKDWGYPQKIFLICLFIVIIVLMVILAPIISKILWGF